MSDHEWCRDVAADMTIAEFCDAHGACREGREWALSTCATMREVWATARPDWLLWVATRRGVLDDRTLRMFAVWCARQVQHLMTDPRSLAALDVAERHARGKATDEELLAAESAAWSATLSSAASASWSAAWSTAGSASVGAWSAAWRAAWSEADLAARSAQSAWLREHATPNFSRQEVKA